MNEFCDVTGEGILGEQLEGILRDPRFCMRGQVSDVEEKEIDELREELRSFRERGDFQRYLGNTIKEAQAEKSETG